MYRIKVPTEEIGIQTNMTSEIIEKTQQRVAVLTKDMEKLELELNERSNQHNQMLNSLQTEIKALKQQQQKQL